MHNIVAIMQQFNFYFLLAMVFLAMALLWFAELAEEVSTKWGVDHG